jgi:hypothetical protein
MPRSPLLALALLAACDPGSLYDSPVVTDDGGLLACEPGFAVEDSGHHNPGTSCLSAGCHHAGGGPAFTVAGTLYDRAIGGAPVGGATVVVVDGDGKRLALRSAANGNFWTSEAVQMPLLLRASQCPQDNPMISLSTDGDCNRGGCHGPGDLRVALQ